MRQHDAEWSQQIPVLIVLVGLALGTVTLVEIVYVVAIADSTPQAFYIGLVTSIPFILGTVYVGYWLYTGTLSPDRFPRIAVWWGGCVLITITGILVINLSFRPFTLKMVVGTVRWSAAIGCGIGLSLGIFEARAIRRAVEVSESRMRQEELQQKLEAAQLGQAMYETEPTRLSDAVQSAWTAVESAGSTVAIDADAVINADTDRLEEIVRLVFESCLSSADGSLEIEVGRLDTASGFYIAHDGRAVPREHREILREFPRVMEHGGAVASLAMADQLASAHGWTLTIDRRDGRTVFEFVGATLAEAEA